MFTLEATYYAGVAQLSEYTYLLFGPAVPVQLTWEKVVKSMSPPIYSDNRNSMSMLLMSASITTYIEFINGFGLGLYLYDGKLIDEELICFEEIANLLPTIDTELAQYVFDERENMTYHTPQSLEISIFEAIENGDMAALKRRFMEPLIGRQGVLSVNPERQKRYLFVTGVALSARAAMRGGLNYEEACSTADIYCQMMDSLHYSSDFDFLHIQMMQDFCKKVSQVQQRSTYSVFIHMCCDYIDKNLNKVITLDLLSKVCNRSPRRLSKQFQIETGMSVMDYIHEAKMKEAAFLLRYTTYSISSISCYLDYSSQSYFCAIFKKKYQMTPGQYRIQTSILDKRDDYSTHHTITMSIK